MSATTASTAGGVGVPGGGGNNNLNINLPENNAILRLEVELRDKNAPKYRRAAGVGNPAGVGRGGRGGARGAHNRPGALVGGPGGGGGGGGGITGNIVNTMLDLKGNAIVPLEKVC